METSGTDTKRSSPLKSPMTRNDPAASDNHDKDSTLESNKNVADTADDEANIQNNPLRNPLIINKVLKSLGMDELKQCRLVCKKWNDLAISFMDKISVIKIGCPEKVYGKENEMSPKSYNEFWEDSDRIFQAFKLKSFPRHEAPWPVKTLVGFFNDKGEIMQELTIDNIDIEGYQRYPESFSVTDYFSISPFISNDLTHLAIDNTKGSKFIVSTNKLTSAKTLTLNRCALNVVKGLKLSPEKFELNNVVVVQNGQNAEEDVVNDFINFENLKELTVNSTWVWYGHSFGNIDGVSLAIDMLGKTTLNMLFLNRSKIFNFKESQWQINGKFKLRHRDYTEQTEIKFTEMDFGKSTIRLGALPKTIEKLVLKKANIQEFPNNSPLLNLPNLKSLELLTDANMKRPVCQFEKGILECTDEDEIGETDEDNKVNEVNKENGSKDSEEDEVGSADNDESDGDEYDDESDDDEYDDESDEDIGIINPFTPLSLFSDCENLETVKLRSKNCKCCMFSDQDLNTDWIPPTTNNLFLTGNIRANNGKEVILEKLVIQDNHLDDIVDTVKRLKSKHLILDLNSKLVTWNQTVEQIILAVIEMPFESLAIGSLDITETAFNESSFSKFVDHRAEYYVFENQKGKSIMEWEFRRMTK